MKIIINGNAVEAHEGQTILEAARANGYEIPTLCYLREQNEIAACRICVVEVAGANSLVPACATKVAEGMEITTDSEKVRRARRMNLELICADHRMECTECFRGGDCRLRNLCSEYGVDDQLYGSGDRKKVVDNSCPHIVRDNSKCVLCRRCVSVCPMKAIAVNNKGQETNVGFGLELSQTGCIRCGQCVSVCPTGALVVHDETKQTWKAILRREKVRTAAMVSPYVCNQIGMMFGDKEPVDRTGQVAAMLRRIGFDEIYLTGTAVTACPAWRNYISERHPELMGQLPVGETPWQKCARVLKSEKTSSKLHVTAITTCVAEKGTDLYADEVITVRELAAMWQRACVSSFTAQKIWTGLPNEEFDTIDICNEACESVDCGLKCAEEMLKSIKLNCFNVLACPGGCACGGGSVLPK